MSLLKFLTLQHFYPYINELKEFLKPYIELNNIPDSDGNYPGRINKFCWLS